MLKSHIGVIGMGVMGKNLTFNIMNHGYKVSIFNRSKNRINEIISKHHSANLMPFFTLENFISSLKIPRRIILMIKSGDPVDEIIRLISPHLSKNDIIIDAGNSFYLDTIKRCNYLKKYGVHFLGIGVSGGEEGALKGPCIMPGGSKEAYNEVRDLFQDISAKYNGESCSEYIGPNGAGHYVKMVHNGIEYSDMQLIAESYFILKYGLKLNNIELSLIFKEWNQGELESYLIEITSHILSKKNEDGNFILDLILDEASNKGTGTWTAKSALDLHVPLSLITESVFSRYLSSIKSQRVIASTLFKGPKLFKISDTEIDGFIEDLRKSLFLGKILSYSQGFSQMKSASEKYKWNLKFYNIAKIFRSGCIIKAKLLQHIMLAFENNNDLINLLFSPYFSAIVNDYQTSLRRILIFAIKNGISLPVFSSALAYYDGYRSKNLSANLIQAQRDYFGAHTYKMFNKVGNFHTDWYK